MESPLNTDLAHGILQALALACGVCASLIAATMLLLRGTRLSAGLQGHLMAVSLTSVLIVPFVAFRPASPEVSSMAIENARFSTQAAGKFPDVQSAPAPAMVVTSSAMEPILVLVWVLGVGACLLRLAWRLGLTARLISGSRPVRGDWMEALDRSRARIGMTRRVRLASHPEIETPMAWGPPGSLVLIPTATAAAAVADARGDLTLLHELAHIRRRDSLTSLLADLACAVAWFLPLTWWARRQLRCLQERAADSVVISCGVRPSTYSGHLLGMLRSRYGPAAAGVHSMNGGGVLSRRIRSILDARQDHGSPSSSVGRWTWGFFGAGCLAMAAAAQESQEAGILDHEFLHEVLNPVLVNGLTDHHIAGAAVCVVHEGRTVYQHGVGRPDVLEDTTVDPEHTIFRIGSVTKVVTGVAVLQCVDRGLLDLDADVNEYLEDFKVEDTFEEPVRVRHLLTHTAGFDQLGYGRHVRSREAVSSLGEFLADNLVRIRPPGQVSCYDTYAITLAGHLVELVTGLTYEEYLERHIFEPMGMSRSFITIPDDLRDDVAMGYEFRGEWLPQRWEFMNTDPASTVNSTVADMGRFATMLLEGGSFGGQRILSEESVEAMFTRQFTNHPDQPGYSLTLFEDPGYGVPAFNHGGSMTGFGCFLYMIPGERLGAFIAYNQESGRLAHDVIQRLVEETMGPLDLPQPRPHVEGVDLARFVGTYAAIGYNHTRPERGGWSMRTFEATESGGQLIFQGRASAPVGKLTLQTEDQVLLTFLEDPAGEIEHLVIRQSVYERVRR